MDAATLCALIKREFNLSAEIGPDTALISSGLLDSLRFAELVLLIERAGAVTLDLADLGVDNFDTPRQMAAVAAAAR